MKRFIGQLARWRRDRNRVRSRRRQRGMTLVEIMVVVVIISLVMGVVGVAVFGQLEEAQKRTAQTQMGQIGESLKLYKLQHRKFPSSADGLSALTSSKGGSAPIMDSIPEDPWGNAYVYRFPGTRNSRSFDLMSYGPDGSPGGGDDIGNWDESAAQ